MTYERRRFFDYLCPFNDPDYPNVSHINRQDICIVCVNSARLNQSDVALWQTLGRIYRLSLTFVITGAGVELSLSVDGFEWAPMS